MTTITTTENRTYEIPDAHAKALDAFGVDIQFRTNPEAASMRKFIREEVIGDLRFELRGGGDYVFMSVYTVASSFTNLSPDTYKVQYREKPWDDMTDAEKDDAFEKYLDQKGIR